MHDLIREQWIDLPRQEVFPFFADAKNLGRITPDWLNFEVLTPDVEMRPGAIIEYRIRLHGIPLRWRTRIERWEPPACFVDVQESGPYRTWRHTHTFIAEAGRTLVRDHVEYALPFGWLGALVNRFWVRRDVERIFAFRERALRESFNSEEIALSHGGGPPE